MPERVKKLMEWYERRLAPLAFAAGFIFDGLTLTRADLAYDNAILIAHLASAAIGILLTNAYESGRLQNRYAEKAAWIFPFLIQFSFGALFSGFTVLYVRSGSIASSWLFIAILALLLVGNEFLRRHYRRMVLHLAVYFVALFAYMVFAVPLLLNRVGQTTFLLSGAASLGFIGFFMAAISLAAGQRAFKENRRSAVLGIAGIYLAFNGLYFANIIPPIPLTLKQLGIYHYVARTAEGNYIAEYEPAPKFALFRETDRTFRWLPGRPVYAYSSVFAPADIGTMIEHRWEYLDPETGDWIERDRISFPIQGGRNEGYRGYSVKYGVAPGTWRVKAATGEGQILGQRTFEVVEYEAELKLEIREL